MRILAVFVFLLMIMSFVRGEPPECQAPDSEDVEILVETIAGYGPVSVPISPIYDSNHAYFAHAYN